MPNSRLITIRLPMDIIESIPLSEGQTVGLWCTEVIIDRVNNPPKDPRNEPVDLPTMTALDDDGNPIWDE